MTNTTYKQLIDLLDQHKAHYKLIDHAPEGRTDIVSSLRGNKLSQAAKCIIMMVKIKKKITKYILGVVPGDANVNLDAVKELLDGSYISFAPKDIAEKLAGSVLGTVLPFSFHPELELMVDPLLLENEEIYFNAARLDQSMVLKTSDYKKIVQPRLEHIAQYGTHNKQEKQENDALSTKRHSYSHILAQAVLQMFPEAKLGIGPAIDNGFYYDFDLPRTLIPEDLPLLEERMRKIIAEDQKFERYEEPVKKSIEYLEKIKQPYKVELAKELEEQGEKQVSFYKNGTFADMCAGPHIDSTKQLDTKAFKLVSIAGAYWRGSEKNPMLQRIYGWAFDTEKELKAYEQMMEEAKKRDHRELGKRLELFTFSDEIGAGLPIWLPYGAAIRETLEALAKKKEFMEGYVRVSTPVITKENLFLKSGHLPHYKDSMYSPMDIDGENYYIKPMNCPFHHTVYASRPRSYKELPLRVTEYGLCHRYEKSGELQGLFRVRSMCMNDAHIYVRPDQVKEEIKKVLSLHEFYYKLFDIKKIIYFLAKHDKKELGKKYVNMPEAWIKNEQILREVLQEMNLDFHEEENEAAFYGPKIDIKVHSAIGKEYAIGTDQLDFAQPMRFELRYIDEHGQEVMPYCIHRAPLSTHERFIGFLIEHYAGAFPVWLAPVQVKILPVSDKFNAYALKVAEQIKAFQGRVEVDVNSETLGKKIRNAEMMKVPHILVVGEKEEKEEAVTVRLFSTKEQKVYGVREYLEELKELVRLPV